MSGSKRAAPRYDSLPAANLRAVRYGPELTEISVRIEVVTPILGGAALPRTVDEIDFIRTATIRGHLRSWWRALNGHRYERPEELYARESELWGRAAGDEGGRSAIELRVGIEQAGKIDSSKIRLQRSKEGEATPGAYALWPAREEKKENRPTAPRRTPGTTFLLALTAPSAHIQDLENAVRAWLLFGGYGSRTRRGLGSFRVLDAPRAWLPYAATRQELERLFGRDIFAAPGRSSNDVPRLAGAALHVGHAQRDAQTAWKTALEWLKEFRQGTSGNPGGRAREPGADGRPSISNWPEPDKIRQLSRPQKGLPWAHKPRHNGQPAWPRAGFGLPIRGRFQGESRERRPGWKQGDKQRPFLLWHELPPTHANFGTEPGGDFEIAWRERNEEYDRLASPLIVKAMALANSEFVPCALWLNRAYPQNGEVVLRGVRNSVAPFDLLMDGGDTPRFSALAGKQSLREAFFDWLDAKYPTTVVAP